MEGGVKKAEGDAVVGDRGDVPSSSVVANKPTVKGIFAAVFIFGDMAGDTVDREGAVLDPIGITTNDGAEVGVIGSCVNGVLRCVVIAHDHIGQIAIAIRYDQGGETGAIWN